MARTYPAEQSFAQTLGRPFRLLIGGALADAHDLRTVEIASPADGRALARVPFAGRADVDRAVAAAAAAFPGWRATPLTERVARLREIVAVLRANREELAALDAIDSGSPLNAMLGDVNLACAWLEYQAGVAMEVKGQTLPSMTRSWLLTRREPYGVVARISAFNHPILFTAGKLAAPLAVGNTIVVKAPDQAPLSSLRFGELIRDVVPPGVINIVSGDGAETGDTLVRHPRVKRIAFIGSIATAQRIQRAAGESGIKHVSLELGGKNPMVVFPDADLDKAVEGAALGTNMLQTQGESCGSVTRLFLHESIHDEVLAKLAARLARVRIDHPLARGAEMGALVSRAHFDKVMSYVELGREEGARLVLGGGRPGGEAFEKGFYVEPTIFADVTMRMRIAREEIFGPVLSVLRWSDREQVLREANELSFGLTAAVWTRDLETACDFADRLEAGYVWVNGAASHYLGAPFSGHKSSGVDVEEGFEELLSYTELKTISIVRS